MTTQQRDSDSATVGGGGHNYTRQATRRERDKLPDKHASDGGGAHKLTGVLRSSLREGTTCIRNAALMDPRKTDNLFGMILKEFGNEGMKLLNFRAGLMTINGSSVIVAAMANPVRAIPGSKKMTDTHTQRFFDLEFGHVLSVAGTKWKFTHYQKILFPQKVVYVNAKIEDFSVPSERTARLIVSFARARARLCQNFVVHCGEGWGRSGMALVIIFAETDEFRYLVNEYSLLNGFGWLLSYAKKITLWNDEKYENASTSKCSESNDVEGEYVCEATNLLRVVLNELREYERVVESDRTEGSSVETISQLRWLDYYLICKAKSLKIEHPPQEQLVHASITGSVKGIRDALRQGARLDAEDRRGDVALVEATSEAMNYTTELSELKRKLHTHAVNLANIEESIDKYAYARESARATLRSMRDYKEDFENADEEIRSYESDIESHARKIDSLERQRTDAERKIEVASRQISQLGTAYAGVESAVQALLDAKADANLGAPIVDAASSGNSELVQTLLSHGGDTNARLRGKTALTAAIYANHYLVVERLLAHGATNVEQRDGEHGRGRVPLVLACELGNYDIVRALLAARANVDAFDDFAEMTALEAASLERHDRIMSLLQK